MLFLYCFSLQAQNRKIIDSLSKVYNTLPYDTTRALILNNIALEYKNNKPDTCIQLAEKVVEICHKINFEKGKAKAYTTIGAALEKKGKNDNAIAYYQKALQIFEKIDDKMSVINTLNSIGFIYHYIHSNYPQALNYYQRSLELAETIGDKKQIAYSWQRIGNVYYYQANYAQAMEIYYKVLKIHEEIDNQSGVAAIMNNIANIYYYEKKYTEALEYYHKGVRIREKLGDKASVANGLNNMGIVYQMIGNFTAALDCHKQSLKIFEELADKQSISGCLANIGIIYQRQGNHEQALYYLKQSLQIREEIGDRRGKVNSLNELAHLMQEQGKYDQSIEYALQGLQIAREIKAGLLVNQISQTLYKTYKLKGDYAKALEYHELYKQTNDSIFNLEKSKAIANLEARAELEKKAKEIEILNKTKELLEKDNQLQKIENERQRNARLALEKQAEAERLLALAQQERNAHKQDSLRTLAEKKQLEAERLKAIEQELKAESKARQLEVMKEKEAKELQQKINYLILIALFSILILTYFIYQSKQKEKHAKEIIAQQKEAVLQQKEEIQQINNELKNTLITLEKQKAEIEYKNRAIADSIAYAQRIQKAILPLDEFLQAYLPEFFILFQPRDVVSGDFYYFEEKNNQLILAVIDCTGHGVPGAFMTMIASEILNEIIQIQAITEADVILNQLHKAIRKSLKQAETDNRDGMDLALIVIDKTLKQVAFAGAKNPLIYIQNGELYHIKGDTMPIGGEQREIERKFTKHLISLNSPTMFYLFSDGYQDQIGGKANKKFMISQMKQIFLEIHTKDMTTQKTILMQRLNDWMAEGKEKQTDDILVLGLRLG
ncbi:MAG: tetratricopeptide repeat protein [Microscillaceae bacterium]|nr:tetratricopeptide repeat protein [Microscillaceae bacterium]MDW8459586.1 tetratricopeptide repeat protein [Cytophagales bacterium]